MTSIPIVPPWVFIAGLYITGTLVLRQGSTEGIRATGLGCTLLLGAGWLTVQFIIARRQDAQIWKK